MAKDGEVIEVVLTVSDEAGETETTHTAPDLKAAKEWVLSHATFTKVRRTAIKRNGGAS